MLGISVLLLVIVTHEQFSPDFSLTKFVLLLLMGVSDHQQPFLSTHDWTLLFCPGTGSPRPNWTAALALPNVCESCWVRTPSRMRLIAAELFVKKTMIGLCLGISCVIEILDPSSAYVQWAMVQDEPP